MKHTLKDFDEKPMLSSKDNIITEVNKGFINLSGYNKKELIGKSIAEINSMLRIDSQVYLQNIENKYNCYMFTKKLESREVNISCKNLKSDNKKIYIFEEKANSRIEDKCMYLEQLYKDNRIGVAIYGFPDLILLKANEKHLYYRQYNKKENAIGKKLKQIIIENQCDDTEEYFLKTIERIGKSCYKKELKYNHLQRGDTYWDTKLVPIYVEEKIKYLIQTTYDVTEKVLNRKLIEKQAKVIATQKEELEAIIENISDGVCALDKDFNITLLNSSMKEFIYEPDSVKKVRDLLKYSKYYDLDGNLLTLENLQEYRILKGEKIKDDRRTCHRPDGIYHLSVSGSPVYDKIGSISKAIICIRDVTDRVNKSEVIRQQKQQLEAIIENVSDELIICDKSGKYIMYNKTFRNNLFYDFKGIITSNSVFEKAEYFDIDGKPIPFKNFPSKRVANGEKFSGYRMDIKNKNGIIHREISASPIYDDKGNFIVGVLVGRDITERVKNEESLLIKTQYDILNDVIENFDLGYTRISFPDFKIKYINAKDYENFKQANYNVGKPVSIIGKNLFDVFQYSIDERSQIKTNIQNLIDKKASSFHLNKKAVMLREEKFFRIIYQPLFGINNQITELICISIDVTEEVKAKNKMEETLKVQDEIFSNISHELRTPLNVICSTNQLTELYLKSGSVEANKGKILKNSNIIKQNCYRFTKLINNIVDSSKIDSGFFMLNLSNENIVNIVEDIVQSVSDYVKGKGLSIIFDTNTEEKIIACDPDKIERIILNLISNAIKFTNTGGNIFVNLIDKYDTVEILVEDTGIGMDKKHLDNIFKRFHQVNKSLSRNAEGSGIGLSLVKSIVKMHGGTISVDSEVGKGSIFRVELPARIVKNPKVVREGKSMKSKIEMVNVEFSDIYAI